MSSNTKYRLTRDITGAPGDILPFSDIIIPANDVTVQVPEENNWYVAEFSILPATGNVSQTEILYNENPSIQISAIAWRTTDLSFRKVVKGGSSIVMNKYRASDPNAEYRIYLYAI